MRRVRAVPQAQFRAGVIALVLMAMGIWIAFSQGSMFRDPYEVKAIFRNAPEVHSRTPVRVAGVEVGRVAKVEPGPGSAATVTMAINRGGLPVHRDAEVKIRTRLFLEGNFFLDLHPGTPDSPEIDEGGTIPLSQTAVPVQLDEILSDFRYSTRANVTSLVRELSRAVDKGGADSLRRTLPYLEPSLLDLAIVGEAARGTEDGDLAGVLRDGERVARAIASREAQLPDLVTGLNRTVRALSSRQAQLEASLPELDGLLGEAYPALAEVRRLMPPARAFANELRPGIEAAPATLRPALPFLDEADRLAARIPAFTRAAEPSLASLARLEPGLARVLGLVTPVTECLRRNAIPTLKTPVDDGQHSTGDPVYKDLLHSLPGQASASQNFDGNGPAIRYHAGFGAESFSLGNIPGTSEPLVGSSDEPILGSRPKRPASKPPFRPDVPCEGQQRPDLRAETGPAPASQSGTAASRGRGKPVTPSQLRRDMRKRIERLAKAVGR